MDPLLKFVGTLILAILCAAPCRSSDNLSQNVHSTYQQTVTPRLHELSILKLEKHLVEMDDQLGRLASFSLRSGIGVIGYRSHAHRSPEHEEWVEVQLDNECAIDEIVLVPTLWRDKNKGFRSDGFPQAIRIVAGTADDRGGTVVAQYDADDLIEPRIGPLVVALQGVTASWVRIEATRLSPRAYDGKHVFQLAEILIFSGMENVGLRAKVSTSSNSIDQAGAWDKRFLVDGLTPYLMNSSQGQRKPCLRQSLRRTTGSLC